MPVPPKTPSAKNSRDLVSIKIKKKRADITQFCVVVTKALMTLMERNFYVADNGDTYDTCDFTVNERCRHELWKLGISLSYMCTVSGNKSQLHVYSFR